jgi:ABC-type multidrug transport system fused ATPase/permease subunit
MTNSEFKKLVAESENQERCERLTIDFHYATKPAQERKTGLTTIYEYVKKERNAWKRVNSDLPKLLTNSFTHFDSLLNKIENFAVNFLSRDERTINNQWSSIVIESKNKKDLYSANSAEAQFLIQLHSKYPNAVGGAHSFFMSRGNHKMNLSNVTHDIFIGYILAYEHELQDETEIQQRRNNEKISLGKIRSDFEKYLADAGNHVQEITNETIENFKNHLQKVDELEKKKEELFDQWFSTTMNNFKTFDKDSHKKIEDLEKLYKEKLHFSAPVQYWIDRASNMKDDGKKWAIWFGVSIIVSAVSLFILLWIVPDEMTAALFSGKPSAIKWTLLFITFISFLAYGVRTFAKLTFSSYHLARDAEEREQLTHVYLALKKDGNVEKEDRQIILQSLFSRAETGLLKDDSSPTMPGTFLEKISGIK